MPESAEEQELTDEQILDQLDKLVNVGALQYVLPTNPLGERWTIGHKGRILTFNSEEIRVFLLGGSVVAEWLESRCLPRP